MRTQERVVGLRTAALCAALLAVLATLVLAAPAGANQSPYTNTGSIAAYDADGQPIEAGYYDRSGGGKTASLFGAVGQEGVVWPGPGPDGGPTPSSTFIGAGDPTCPEFQDIWPYSTVPGDQDHCWIGAFAPSASDPGTYGIIMPPSRVVNGETQVFDHWNVTDAITAGKCRTGDMGLGVIDGNTTGDFTDWGARLGFASGPEYRIWTDLNNNLGMNATIEAHYARVSPDTSAPLVTIDPAIDCAVREQNETSLVASFSCRELSDLASGVASCTGRNDGHEVAVGDPLDTSTIGTHDLTVTALDNAGNERSQTMHYTVEEINDAPTAVGLSNTSVAEDEPAGTAVGTFATTDEDIGDTFTYSLVDGDGSTDNASFSIDGDTLRTAESFDFEVKSAYTIRVRSTDAGGKSIERTFPITVENLLEPTLAPTDVAENAPPGTIVGTLGPECLNGPAFFALASGPGDADNGSFWVDDPSAQNCEPSSIRTAASFDFETKNVYHIRVSLELLSGGPGPSDIREEAFTIHVTDVNEPPTAVSLSNASVAENQAAGTTVGSLSTADPDSGDTSTYALVDGTGSTDNGRFSLAGATLKTAASFDYEAKSSYSIRVRTTDHDGLSLEQVFTIDVTDANDPPTGVSLSNASVAENQAIGTTVGSLSTADPDSGDTFTYALVAGTGSTDNGRFTIEGATLKTAASFDFETKSSYSIRVESTDRAGAKVSRQLTVTVTDVPEGPTVTVAPGGACNDDATAQGQIALVLARPDGSANGLSLAVSANTNTALVPASGVTLAGTGANRTLTVKAVDKKTGTAALTLRVSDGSLANTVVVTVRVGTGAAETLTGGSGTDLIFGLGGANTLDGAGGIDLLCGGNSNDTIAGGDGNDTLDGGRGDDALSGGDGADILRGGAGADRLTGGAGVDAFDGGAGTDRATDRVAGETLTGVELLGN